MKILNKNKKEYLCLHKGTIAKKRIFYILVFLICLSCTGCNKASNSNDNKNLGNITTVPVSPTIAASQDTSIEKNIKSLNYMQ
jgi:hypothetical protein